MRAWIHLIGFFILAVGLTVPLMAQDSPDLPIAEDVLYTIRPSDTLDAIGALFDMSPRCIAATNEIVRVSELKIGDEILLSVACPRYAEDPTYLPTSAVLIPREVVRVDACAGVRASYSDTVASLARLLSVTEEDLRVANNLEEDEEPSYQQCLISPVPALADETDGSGGGSGVPEGEFYVIGFGDTLSEIAMTRNVSLETLRLVNGIGNGWKIQAGTTIFIPSDAPAYGEFPAMFRLNEEGKIAGTEYIMQPGDTLDSVARENDVSIISLMMANSIENNRFIQAGTVIIIPDDAAKYGEFPPLIRDESLGQGGGGQEYVVQPGDFPQQIAREFNVDLITFMDVNHIENAYALQPGTVLVIPTDAPPFSEGIPPVSIRSANPTSTPTRTTTDTSSDTTGTDTINTNTDAGGLVPVDQLPTDSPGGLVPVDQLPSPTPETLFPDPVATEQAQ